MCRVSRFGLLGLVLIRVMLLVGKLISRRDGGIMVVFMRFFLDGV